MKYLILQVAKVKKQFQSKFNKLQSTPVADQPDGAFANTADKARDEQSVRACKFQISALGFRKRFGKQFATQHLGTGETQKATVNVAENFCFMQTPSIRDAYPAADFFYTNRIMEENKSSSTLSLLCTLPLLIPSQPRTPVQPRLSWMLK